MSKPLEFAISWKSVKAVALFASQDFRRDALCGVHVEYAEGKDLILVATDGRTLLVIKPEIDWITKPEEDVEFLIPSHIVKIFRPSKCKFKFNAKVRINPETKFIRVTEFIDGLSVSKKMADMSYPKWRQVVPSPAGLKHGVQGAFNLSYLNKFDQAAYLLGHKSVSLFQKEWMDPIMIKTESDDFHGVMMPYRTDNTTYNHPSWL